MHCAYVRYLDTGCILVGDSEAAWESRTHQVVWRVRPRCLYQAKVGLGRHSGCQPHSQSSPHFFGSVMDWKPGEESGNETDSLSQCHITTFCVNITFMNWCAFLWEGFAKMRLQIRRFFMQDYSILQYSTRWAWSEQDQWVQYKVCVVLVGSLGALKKGVVLVGLVDTNWVCWTKWQILHLWISFSLPL